MTTVNTTNITGFIVLPNDVIREKSSVIFTMTGFDTDADDNATVVPIPVVASIGNDGSINENLWPNPEGVRTTFYRVTFSMYNGVNPVLVDGGLIEVPATGGPYDLNDLLPIAPPSGATVDEYIAQLAAAVTSASSSAASAGVSAVSAADSAQEAADIVAGIVPEEPSFVLSIGASAIAGSSGATGGSLDVLPGVNLWDSNSNGATYVAGTQFNTAAFGTDPLNVNSGLANSTPLHAINGVRQLVGGSVYGAFLAMGGQDPEALITDATLAANSWTRDPSDEDLTLHYANIQSAIDAMPGSKTVADYLIYYQHNNSGTGRAYYQPRVKAILDDLVTAGLIDDTTKIVLVEANPDRSDAIIESVQDSLTDIASRDYPNAVTVGQGGIPTHDGIHPSGVGCVWLGQRISQALLGGGVIPTQRIVFTDRSNNDLDSIAELNKWNGDNYRIRHTNDTGYVEANWNAQSQVWRVTGTGDVDYMRVESTGIEDTPIGATTPTTGKFSTLISESSSTPAVNITPTAGGGNYDIRIGASFADVSYSVANGAGNTIHTVEGFSNAHTQRWYSQNVNVMTLNDSGLEVIGASGSRSFRSRIEGATNNPLLDIIHDEAGASTTIDSSGSLGCDLILATGSGEALRIDTSQRIHIGHTGATATPGIGNATTGTSMHGGGRTIHSRDSGPALDVARVGTTPNGQIQRWYAGATGAEVGSVSSRGATIEVEYGSNGPIDTSGSGTPEGAVSARVGSTYRRTDGGAGTSFYVKESGTGSTGWVAK